LIVEYYVQLFLLNVSIIKALIFFCTITFFLFFCLPAQASSAKEILNQAEQLGIANHPTWLKLLHYEHNNRHSVVLTENFFLSPNGKNDPIAELSATINAYFAPDDGNNDEHARCRFPARYFWLSQQLPLPNYNIREPKCQKLENWALFDTVKSISLLLVSGYLGNPASTFGHALLKLNTDSTDDQFGLFDSTLNYGALVPENENVLLYIVKGIGGGYEAGFSDKYFYTQDMVYSHTEQRDIWEYKLRLSDEARLLLIFHIWEIVGHKFAYYFLDKNCAYRLAELLELVLDEELLGNVLLWYVPVELFHRLNEIDKVRRESIGKKLIQSVRFIPSSQRKLYHKLNLLTTEELEIFNAIIRKGIHFSDDLEKISVERKILILDNLLAYYEYKILAEKPESNRHKEEVKKQEEIKKQILLARLQLPARSIPSIQISDLPSPADGSPHSEFGIKMGNDSLLRLNWSPFKKELIGLNSLEGDELVVFDLTIGLLEEEHKFFFDQLDLIRVLNLNTLPIELEDENEWSWKLRIGADRLEKDGKDFYDGVMSFGAGYAWKWNKNITGYGMTDISAHTLFPYARLRPHFGLRFDWGKTRAWFYLGAESISYNQFSEVFGGKIQYQLTVRYAFYAEFSNEKSAQSFIGFKWYYW